MSLKILITIVCAATLCACSTYTPPPEPFGPKVPVNGAEVMEDPSLTAAGKNDAGGQSAVLLDEELSGAKRIVSAAEGHEDEDKTRGLDDVKKNWFRK